MKLALTILTLAATAAASHAASIGVSFGADAAGGGDPVIEAGDSVGAFTATNWNNANGQTASITGAVDDSGAATGMNVAWSSDESWSYNTAIGGNDAELMTGWISMNTTGNDGTVDITSIPYANYDLYIYSAHDRVDTTTRFTETNGAFSEITITEDITNTSVAADPFVFNDASGGGAGNYAVISGLSASTLNIVFDNPNSNRAGFAGFQIVQVPEPTVSILLGLGGFAYIFRRRK